jgi:hypothetical protein
VRTLSHSLRGWRAPVALLTSLCTSACLTWHPEQVAPQTVLQKWQPTTLRVTRTDSSQVVLDHPELHGDTLVGIGRDKTEVRVPLDSVRQTATRRIHAGKTVLAIVGIGAAALGVALIALIIHCSENTCSD